MLQLKGMMEQNKKFEEAGRGVQEGRGMDGTDSNRKTRRTCP